MNFDLSDCDLRNSYYLSNALLINAVRHNATYKSFKLSVPRQTFDYSNWSPADGRVAQIEAFTVICVRCHDWIGKKRYAVIRGRESALSDASRIICASITVVVIGRREL